MGEQVIVLTDLTKQYGNFTAVDLMLAFSGRVFIAVPTLQVGYRDV